MRSLGLFATVLVLTLAVMVVPLGRAPAGHGQTTEPTDVVAPKVWMNGVPKRCARKAFKIHGFATDETQVAVFDMDFRGGGPFKGAPDYGPEAVWPPTTSVHRYSKIRMPAPAFKRRFEAEVTVIAEDESQNVASVSRRFRVCAPPR